MVGKKTTEQFIQEARNTHGDMYDYSLVDYKSSKESVTIICPIHGEFEQRSGDHIRGSGCVQCSYIERGNSKRKTNEKFVMEMKEIHGDRYDYSKAIYKNNKTAVIIICPDHGEFKQRPDLHIRGEKCPKCADASRKIKLTKTLAQFIQDAINIHGNEYDYSMVDYRGNKVKVKILCPKHGEFLQKPNAHLGGQGCPICSNRVTKTTEQFIKDAKKVHKDQYDYSLVEYRNAHEKVIIICKLHGEFAVKPNNHLNESGCPKCANLYISLRFLKNTEEFVEDAVKVHGDEYDYSLVDYNHSKTKVIIICKKHGEFLQKPNSHLGGQGCPTCKQSKGEKAIRNFLKQNNVQFVQQQKFNDCRDKKQLPFDFYIRKINMLIEFDGRQHRESVSFFGGVEAFDDRKKKDLLKTNYAKNNSIGLIRITNINKIEQLLSPWIEIYNKIIEDSTSETIKYVHYNDEPFIDDLVD